MPSRATKSGGGARRASASAAGGRAGGAPFDLNLIQAHKALEMASYACAEGGTLEDPVGAEVGRAAALTGWLAYYNRQRPHASLDYRAPWSRLRAA